MLRFAARLLGYAALAAAMAAGVLDGARGIADGAFQFSSLGGAAQWLFPHAFAGLEPAIGRLLHPSLWNPVTVTILRTPAVPALFAIGFALLVVGRREAEALLPPR